MATDKKCTQCGNVKSVSDFPTRQRKHGPAADSWCHDCYCRRQKERQAKRLTAEKACTKCGVIKIMADFPACKAMVDGRGSWCRACMNAYTQTWRKRAKAAPKVLIDGKVCMRCGWFKHRTAFGPCGVTRNGLNSWCKACVTEQKRTERSSTEGRERTNAAARAYRKTEKARIARKQYRQSQRFRLRDAARKMVFLAVSAGVIERPMECELKGQMGIECRGRIEGHHHNGYDVRYWLDVVWVCQAHHRGIEYE